MSIPFSSRPELNGFLSETESVLQRRITELTSTDVVTQSQALEKLQSVGKHNIVRLQAAVSTSIPDADQKRRIDALRVRYLQLAKEKGLDIPSELREGSGTSAASSGSGGSPAAADGTGGKKPPFPSQAFEVDPMLLAELAHIVEEPISTSVQERIGNWAEAHGFDKTAFSNEVYGAFYHLVHPLKVSLDGDLQDALQPGSGDPDFGRNYIGDARLSGFVFSAMALAATKLDGDYRDQTIFEIDGTRYNFANIVHMFVAAAVKSNPDIITKEQIRDNPEAFLQGILSARAHLELGKTPSIGTSASPLGGAGGAAALPVDLKGLNNSGNDCWAISMLQFIRHSRGLGAAYIERLSTAGSSAPARAAVLSALGEYERSAGTLPVTVGQRVREGFRRTGIGGIDTEGGQHDSGEATLALLGQNIAGELPWTRTRRFINPEPPPGASPIATDTQSATAPIVDARVTRGNLRGEMHIPALIRGTYEGDLECDFHFGRRPEHLVLALRYESLREGGTCPTTFVLPPSMVTGGVEPISMDLDAAIIHHGHAPSLGHFISGGHYSSVVRRDDRWYHLNDSRVSEISGAEARSLLTPSEFSRPVTVHYVRTGEE